MTWCCFCDRRAAPVSEGVPICLVCRDRIVKGAAATADEVAALPDTSTSAGILARYGMLRATSGSRA